MPEKRFYIEGPLEEGEEVTLASDEQRHIAVMRKKVGDEIELINGKNCLARATIKELSKKECRLFIKSVIEGKKSKREFILCLALFDLSRLELAIQKCSELGVAEIWLFPAQKSEKKSLSQNQQLRLHKQVIAVAKQCGRLTLPSLILKKSFISCFEENSQAFYGSLASKAPSFLSCLKEERRILFFVGPPSGFTSEEEMTLEERGALGIHLNENILRTETAALTAVALGMHL